MASNIFLYEVSQIYDINNKYRNFFQFMGLLTHAFSSKSIEIVQIPCLNMDSEFKKKDFLLLVGKRIELIREEKGFSYERVSQGCKIDASDISKITKGRVNITLSSIMELSKGLEIHPKELFNFKIENSDCE